MSLINCPECGKEISDKATFCPNCGFPIEIGQNEEIENEECEDDEEEKETIVSIMSLITFALYVISAIIKNGTFTIIFALTSFILTIIAHCQKGKCVCATIVFWITTIGFALLMLLAFVL